MKTDAENWMSKAIEIGWDDQGSEEVPIGCLLVKENEMIASSGNATRKENHVVTHAEILVIQEASKALHDWRLTDCDLYVTMEPCVMCMGAIILSRIRSVYYGISNPISGAFHGEYPIQSNRIKTLLIGGILEEEIKNRMQVFFQNQRNKKMKILDKNGIKS